VSDYTAVREVTLALQGLLEREITHSSEPQLAAPIHLFSPKVMREKEQSGVSLWLYRVTREADHLNQPPQRVGASTLRQPPIPLTLSYLVTPMTGDPKDEQSLLGKVVQVMNDHTIVRGSDVGSMLDGDGTVLRVLLDGLTLEDLARVWDVLKEPYQLSVAYLVHSIAIDSDRDAVLRPPVVHRGNPVEGDA